MSRKLGIAILWACCFLVDSPLAADEAKRKAAGPMLGYPLAGTDWRLVKFQPMDDAIGTVRPDEPSRYTMRMDSEGTVTMRLNCNHGNDSWSAKAGTDPTSCRFEFVPLATMRA